MQVSARVRNFSHDHEVVLATEGTQQRLAVHARATGGGSAVNGGELLMAALATCYCNDLYREAARLGIAIHGCEVVASARFNGVGSAAESVVYAVKVDSPAAPGKIEFLLAETDRLAEIHNTLRSGCPVQRTAWHEPAS